MHAGINDLSGLGLLLSCKQQLIATNQLLKLFKVSYSHIGLEIGKLVTDGQCGSSNSFCVCGTSLPMTKYGYECPQLPCPRTSKLFVKTNHIQSTQQYHDNLLELGGFPAWQENKSK